MRLFARHIFVAAAVVILTLVAAASAQSPPVKRRMKTDQYKALATAAYDAKDWTEAVRCYEIVADLEPFDAGIQYNLACARALKGDATEALDALRKSIELGWDNPEWLGEQDADLISLHDDPRFRKVIGLAEQCGEETVYVYVPSTVTTDEPAPLIVTLHGFGSNARGYAAYWKEIADQEKIMLAAPRGTVKLARQLAYGWNDPSRPKSVDTEAAARLVDQAIAAAAKVHAIDKQRMVLVGFSQGATVALNVLARDADKFAGAVTFAASYMPTSDDMWNEVSDKRKVRACLFVGERDSTVKDNDAAQRAMTDAGLAAKVVRMPDLGHEMPLEYQKREKAGLQFVFDRDERE